MDVNQGMRLSTWRGAGIRNRNVGFFFFAEARYGDVVSLRVSGCRAGVLSVRVSLERVIVRDGVGPGEAVQKNVTGLLGRRGRGRF